MELHAVIIITLLLFFVVVGNPSASFSNYSSVNNYVNSNVNGSDASVNVNIQNNVNTQSSNTTTTKSSSTKVHISQEGEGTSQVVINGKEWKLEGPGEINVNESSDNGSSTPTEGQASPSPTADDTNPTSTDTQKAISAETLSEELRTGMWDKIRMFFQEFFSKFFNNSN